MSKFDSKIWFYKYEFRKNYIRLFTILVLFVFNDRSLRRFDSDLGKDL